VRRRQLVQNPGATASQLHKNPAPIVQARAALDQILSRKTINQFHRGMVHNLKLLGQVADC
jgi:hypothetical protein